MAAVLTGVLVSLTAIASPAFASSADDRRRDAERRSAAAQKRTEGLAASVEGLSAELGQAVLKLEATQARLPGAQTELETSQQSFEGSLRESAMAASRLQEARGQEASITRTITRDVARGERLRTAVGQMARQAYKGRIAASGLSVALAATSTADFISGYGVVTTALRIQTRALDAVQQVGATDANSQARLIAVEATVAALKGEADSKLAQADGARAAAQARQTEIEQLVSAQDVQQRTLAGMKSQAQAEEAASQAESNSIAAELAGIIALQRAATEAARAAAAARALVAGTKAPPPVQQPSGPVPGALFGNPTSINPIYVTSEYGMRLQPVLLIFRLHAGIDLRAPCGTPVYAGRAGTVLSTQTRGGDGNEVMIDHGFVNGNSVITAYNHLTRYAVVPGQNVTQGQLVGYAGATGGVSTGCHLDFQVYINGATVNPRPYLGM